MKNPPLGIIEKDVEHPETLTFDYLNDENKPVYPETLEEQIEALKNDAQLEYFASCRKAAGENRYKPLYHFSQPNGVLNDPNGPCFWQGRWHLFYQHIMPFHNGDRTIYWGHAVSRDLVHWSDLPDAIYPNPEKECWSGAAFAEEDKVTAIYYGFRGHGGLYTASSSDPLLLNWNKLYPGPVIPGQAGCMAEKGYDVYDPCIWKEGKYYYALAGCREDNPVTGHWMRVEYLYRSENAVDWEYRHPFIEEDHFAEDGDDGACPYFVPFGEDYLLMHFSHARGPKYLVGKYDKENERFIAGFGGRFNQFRTSSLNAPALVPDGKNGAYLFCVIPGGNMSLPYHLTPGEKKGEIGIAPAEGLASLRGNHTRKEHISLPKNQETIIEGVKGDCLEIVARFAPTKVSVLEMKVLRSPDAEEYAKITFYRNRGAMVDWSNPMSVLSVDTERLSLHAPEGTDVQFAAAPDNQEFRIEHDEGLELHVFLDKSLIDVFANDRAAICKRVYPSREDSLGISFTAIGGESELLSLDVWEMDGIDQTKLEGI